MAVAEVCGSSTHLREQLAVHCIELRRHRRAEAVVEGHRDLVAARATRDEDRAGLDVARAALDAQRHALALPLVELPMHWTRAVSAT